MFVACEGKSAAQRYPLLKGLLFLGLTYGISIPYLATVDDQTAICPTISEANEEPFLIIKLIESCPDTCNINIYFTKAK